MHTALASIEENVRLVERTNEEVSEGQGKRLYRLLQLIKSSARLKLYVNGEYIAPGEPIE